MFVSQIDNIYLEPKGVAVFRDRAGWMLETITNRGDKRKTFAQLGSTGDIDMDAVLMQYRKQPAKVIEQPDCHGYQILDIYMRWEL